MKAIVKYGILAAALAILLQTLSPSLALSATLVLWYFLGGKRTLYLIYHTLERDGRTAVRFVHLLWVNLNAKWRNQSVGDLFLKTAARVPDKTMMVLCHEKGEDKMTFRECRDLACQVARYFQQQGYKKGDVVGLVMENRIDYCCYWIGLSMIGVIPALVNSNLRQQSLLHTLTVAKCRGVIFSSELCQAVLELKTCVELPLYCCDIQESSDVLNLPDELRSYSTQPLTEKLADYNSALFYIYTSGTTGLPKPAIIKHSRYLFASYCLFCMGIVSERDVLYSVLPMYHSAGVAVCQGNTLTEGLTMVTRKKLSANKFWEDCVRHKVTVSWKMSSSFIFNLHSLLFPYFCFISVCSIYRGNCKVSVRHPRVPL